MAVGRCARGALPAAMESQLAKQNYHHARKQREQARKARQQAKQQRRAGRQGAAGESAEPSLNEAAPKSDVSNEGGA